MATTSIDTPILSLLSQYFRKKRVMANGVGFSGESVGGLIVPPVVTLAISAYGVRGAMIVLGGLWLHVLLIAAVMRPLPDEHCEDVLEVQCEQELGKDKGLAEEVREQAMDEISRSLESADKKESQLRDAVANCSATHDEESQVGSVSDQGTSDISDTRRPATSGNCCSEVGHGIKDYIKFLSSPKLPCLMVTSVLGSFSYYNLFFIIPPLAREMDISKIEASKMIMLANVAELASRLAVGAVADRLKSRKHIILFISFGLSFVIGLCVSFALSYSSLMAYSVLFGLFGGAFAPMLIPMFLDLVPPDRIASTTGLFPFLTGIGQSLGPPILGE